MEVLVKDLGYRVTERLRPLRAHPRRTSQQVKPDEQVPTQRILVLEVEDVLEAGNDVHRAKMKHERLRAEQAATFADPQESPKKGCRFNNPQPRRGNQTSRHHREGRPDGSAPAWTC